MKLYVIQTNDGKYLGRKGSSGKLKEALFYDTHGQAQERIYSEGEKVVAITLSLVKKRGPDKGFNRYPVLKTPKTGELVY